MISMRSIYNKPTITMMPVILRVGLGLVFIIGGISKLSQLLNPALQSNILASYWGASGYVNQFFIDFLFAPGYISPWFFLTTLSLFELISGIAFLVGAAVRPLSLLYGFLLWTFVMALPVLTVPGMEATTKTYLAPAMLVQIRDIALSGMMFALYNLGPGSYSIDEKYLRVAPINVNMNWDAVGLLLRLSLAIPLGIGAVFFSMPNIQTFATAPWILLIIAILLAGGIGLRYVGIALALVMLWYMAYKLNMDKSLIANLNGFKREFAFIAGGIVLSIFGGGLSHTLHAAIDKVRIKSVG